MKADIKRLADPRGLSAADADRLVADARRSWCGWCTACTATRSARRDAALLEAYHLLAARGDAGVDAVLRDALVLIDPMQNPDGRARFIFQNLQGRAAAPDPAPYNAEHDEPWPGGRSNHYLFDMNRDWFAQTQPETRGRIRVGARLLPAGQRRPARAGRQQQLLLRAAGRPAESALHQGPDRRLRAVRPRQRRAVRRARLAVLHPRGLRRVLSGLRRQLADAARLDRHDLRAGLGPRAVVRAHRRHGADVSATA